MKSPIFIKMNLPVKPLILLFLCFFSMTANAALYYSIKGEISDITNNSIRLVDRTYQFMPTLKILNIEGKPEPLKSLKSGDLVKITILKIDNKRRVDTIQRLARPDEN